MKTTKIISTVFGEKCELILLDFEREDKIRWKNLFDKWKNLKKGLIGYHSRGPNFPEGLSEVAFCIYSGSKKLVKINGHVSASFDTFNPETQKAEQIKAVSVENDLTSFGPRSQWDDLYFLDFYREGDLDGSFDLYKLPTEKLYNTQVNKSQTFRDQQEQGRRPRLRIRKEFIKKLNIQPIAEDIKVWEL